MKESTIIDLYTSNESHFQKVIEFVRKNVDVKQGINRFFNSSLLTCQSNAKEKIRILYIHAISAAGGNNLTRNGKSCKEFYKKLQNLPEDHQIDLGDLFKCFGKKIKSYNDLFKYISRNNLNFGPKKTALFLNNIDWVQRNIEISQKIFREYDINVLELMIPVDNVIVRILNEILCPDKNEKLDQYKDFININNLFKEKLGPEFMLIEDLWFWGYFSTKGNGINRAIVFNNDKFFTAEFLKPTKENRKKMDEFIKLLKRK